MPNVPPRFSPAPQPVAKKAVIEEPLQAPKAVEKKSDDDRKVHLRGFPSINETISLSNWDVSPFKVAEDMDIVIP